jgi:hypothetical protein
MTPDYIVKPDGGLCNYLRVVFSYWLYCKREHKTLGVIWRVTDACPGFFLDYFEPLEGVVFFKNDKQLSIDFNGNRWHPDYNPYKMFIYSGLNLLPDIKSKLSSIRSKLDKYIAVHIRRTDHVRLAKSEDRYTDDDTFIQFINQYPEYNLYVATDNRETQDQLYSLYKERIKVISFITPSISLRQTTIEDAILDIFICKDATHFKGSGFSSYSGTIAQYRTSVDCDMTFNQTLNY